MTTDTGLSNQAYTHQPPPHSLKQIKVLALIAAVLLMALVAGIGVYLLGNRNTQSIAPSLPSATIDTPSTKTVTIQDGYFFKVTIPYGYALIKGEGDYIRYVTDGSGEKIIGFYFYNHLGERQLPTGQTIIDSVPFTIDGATITNNRIDIGCSAGIYAKNAKFKIDHLYFGINTWCKDTHEEQSDIYERIISSIQFSEDLRAVLLGRVPPPLLRD